MRPIRVHDPDDPRLDLFRSLKSKRLDADHIFIAEGDRTVRALLASECAVLSCCITPERYRALAPRIRASGKRFPVYCATPAAVAAIVGFRHHQGVMAAARSPVKRSLTAVAKMPSPPRLFVALNGVNDPENVGLIVRSAAAFGADGLIVDGTSHDPYYRRAVRVSIGAIFGLPVFYEEDLVPALRRLRKKYGMRIIAATPAARSIPLEKVDLTGPACLVFGSEDKGVSPPVVRIADAAVRIPMTKKVDSLNVAAACAVFLYAAARSRAEKSCAR